MEEIDKGTLSREEYPYVKDPAGSSYQSSSSQPGAHPLVNPNSKPVQSRRTVGKPGGVSWALKGRASSEDGYSRFELPLKFVPQLLVSFRGSDELNDDVILKSFLLPRYDESVLRLLFVVCDRSDSVLRSAVSDPKINGRRIFVFIIGGMTRSEVSSRWPLL